MTRTYITPDANEYGETDTPREYFDLAKTERWSGATRWDGSNNADINVGANRRQDLLRTAGGRWVIETRSSWVGEGDRYSWATDEQAHEWLMFNEEEAAAIQLFGPAADERGPGRPAVGPVVKARFDEQTIARIDAFATDHGVSRADAIRQLVEQALSATSV